MKKLFTFITGILLLYSTGNLSAQSFTVAHDTVRISDPSGLTLVPDDITPTSGSVSLRWQVVACNFPADWNNWGVCDNNLCYSSSNLWPSMAYKFSSAYTGTGDFHLQINLDAATTLGCYYVKVRINNTGITTDTATEVYVVCKTHPTATPVITSVNDVTLYPNPATDEVNVVFDANADVKNIAIYNIIGKMMSVYKVNGNSANMSLENMPGGIYFVRLVNSAGNIVATKKFTKQ
jgi:Secretion system C-terminal sorting domain